MTPEEIKKMADDIHQIKQAVIGDKDVGLNGLVNDMASMKQWRDSITIRVAMVSGAVSASILGAKTLLAKLFGSGS